MLTLSCKGEQLPAAHLQLLQKYVQLNVPALALKLELLHHLESNFRRSACERNQSLSGSQTEIPLQFPCNPFLLKVRTCAFCVRESLGQLMLDYHRVNLQRTNEALP